LTSKEILEEYLDHVLSFVDPSAIRPFKLVADANFGFVSRNVSHLANRLYLDLIPVHFEPNGTFPEGPPNPMLEENRVKAQAATMNNNVELCATWDADADRVMFLDETGRFIPGIYVTALLSEIMLRKYPGAKIIFDPRVVWPAFDTVRRLGGEPIMSKSGHAFMKDRMRAEDAVFAGELSAHYFFRDNYYADNGLIPFLLVLEHLSKEDKPFSEVIAPYMENHFVSGELNYKVEDTACVIEKVRAAFGKRGEEDFTDGYSVEGEKWRFNLRPSNTEPLLRLNVEARSSELMEQIRDELVAMIQS
jgi:phosphomannomutase